MKKIWMYVLIDLGCVIASYLTISFILWDLDISSWEKWQRVEFLLISSLYMLIGYAVYSRNASFKSFINKPDNN